MCVCVKAFESVSRSLCVCVKVVESWKVKMRKPERRIYEHTLRALNVAPNEAVFLDDLGANLKSAKELGIRTIKVHAVSSYHLPFTIFFCCRL